MQYKNRVLSVGIRITQLRIERKMSQRELGFRSGTEGSFICRIEKGRTDSKISTLCKIADALDVPVSYFFTD